jgi:N-formylglutamate amidohydrolase
MWECRRFGDKPRLIVHVPHSGTELHAAARSDIRLDDGALAYELALMTDWHTDRLALDACAGSATPAIVFINRLSRLVVDPERLPDDREPMAAAGMGAVYTKTASGARLRMPDHRRDADLLKRFFEPYATAFADLVDEVLASHGTATIIDLHSYRPRALPYELDSSAPRPGVCIGTDGFHTPEPLIEIAETAFTGIDGGTALDTPFAGTYVPSRHYQTDSRVRSLMIEIRRDLYLDEPTHEIHTGYDLLVPRLAQLIETLGELAE